MEQKWWNSTEGKVTNGHHKLPTTIRWPAIAVDRISWSWSWISIIPRCPMYGIFSWKKNAERKFKHRTLPIGSEESFTPPKTNMEPENEPLEEEIPMKNPSFLGSMLVFGGCTWIILKTPFFAPVDWTSYLENSLKFPAIFSNHEPTKRRTGELRFFKVHLGGCTTWLYYTIVDWYGWWNQKSGEPVDMINIQFFTRLYIYIPGG